MQVSRRVITKRAPQNAAYRLPVLQPHFFEKGVYRPVRIPILPSRERLKAIIASGAGEPGSILWFRKGERIYIFEGSARGKGLVLTGVADANGPGTPLQPGGLTLNQLFTFLKDCGAVASFSSAIEAVYDGLDPASRSVSLFGGLVVAKILDGESFLSSDAEETAIADFFIRWMKRTSLESFLEIADDTGTGVMAAYRQMTAEQPECTAQEITQYLNWEGERESTERQIWIRLALATGFSLPRKRSPAAPTNVLTMKIPSDPVAFLIRIIDRVPAHARVVFPVKPRTLQTKRFLNLLFKGAIPTAFFRFEGRPEIWVSVETGTRTGPARAQAKTRFVQFKEPPLRLTGSPQSDWAKEARRLKELDALVRSIRLKEGFFEGPQFRITVLPFRELEKYGISGFIISPLMLGDGTFLERLHKRLTTMQALRRYRGRSRTFLSVSTVRAQTPGSSSLRVCFVVTTETEPALPSHKPLLWQSAESAIPAHYRVYPVRAEDAHILAGFLNHPVFSPLVFEQIRLLEEPFSEMTAGRLLVPAPEAFSAPLVEKVLKAQNEIQAAWQANRTANVVFPPLENSKEENQSPHEARWGYSGDGALFAPIVRVLWQNAIRANAAWMSHLRKTAKILKLPRRGSVSLKAGIPGLILEAGGKRRTLEPEASGPLVLWLVQRGLRTILLPEGPQCGAMMRFLSSLWETGASLLPDGLLRDQFARFYRSHIIEPSSDITLG
jgi:hypothetical protein